MSSICYFSTNALKDLSSGYQLNPTETQQLSTPYTSQVHANAKLTKACTLIKPLNTCDATINTVMYSLMSPVVFTASIIGTTLCCTIGCLGTMASSYTYEDGIGSSDAFLAAQIKKTGREQFEATGQKLREHSADAAKFGCGILDWNLQFYESIRPCSTQPWTRTYHLSDEEYKEVLEFSLSQKDNLKEPLLK